MSNTEREHESLVSRVEQLEQLQHVLAKLIEATESRLDDLSEQFHNRSELQQLAELKNALVQLHPQLDEGSSPPAALVEVVNEPTEESSCTEESHQQPMQVQSHESQLVFDRSGSRAVLMEAIEKAQERLIIVCPWLNRNSIDADLVQKFRDCLNRNCCIDIGWGHLSDAASGGLPVRARNRVGIGWRYDAVKDLRQLEQDYPDRFRLKLLGTHEKFLVCDSTFAMLGSHNMLTSSAQSAEREVGIRTTDSHIIQGLINRFDGAEVQDSQAIDERLIEESVSLDNAETLDTPDLTYQPDASLTKLYDIELGEDEDIDDFAEDERGTAIDAEEFLRRYKEKERDFEGINLSGANLSGITLESCSNASNSVNLVKANLSGTNLTKANLQSIRLLQANLNKANLTEATLHSANFTAADLSGASLMQASLQYANLTVADLNGAVLIQANLSFANLTGANLSKAKLGNANLTNANLSKANLSQTRFGSATFKEVNLTGANLTGASLVGINFSGSNLSGTTLRGANLCGANLSCQSLGGVNLSTADLCGADLSRANLEKANLEKANLKGANLKGASLSGAKLSGAIMPDGTIHD